MVEVPSRQRRQMAAMVALERSLRARLQPSPSAGHPQVADLIERIGATSEARETALAARLEAVAPGTPIPDPVTAPAALEILAGTDAHPASGPLVAALTLLQQAVLGYAVLIELAFRAADSVELLGPDNTGDVAWGHLQEVTSLAQEVTRLLPYAVVGELEAEGEPCRCQCGACGLGICGCPLAFRRRIDIARFEAGPTEAWPAVTLVPPRPGSPAAAAGLRAGDRLLAVEGKAIDGIPMLQDAIGAHAPGEAVAFEVERADGGTETVNLVRP